MPEPASNAADSSNAPRRLRHDRGQPTPWRPDVTGSEHVVVRDGVRLACRDWGGPGQPLVLLHGLAGHAGEWDVPAGRLSSRYRVVAVDQRGHGASERHPRDVSRAAYVADVIAIVDQLALRRPVLVGQSLGGIRPCSPPPHIPDWSAHWCSSRPAPAVQTRTAPWTSAAGSTHGRHRSPHAKRQPRSSAADRSAQAGQPGWRNARADGGLASTGT
ncbi:alpha/beta fold hydrolase [Streptomyces hirsutus]|uniref:alpha/beta fold hydrolase n=1 Tax=Streptomyces hirsutus TaxID=35620 RepID=UPI0034358C8F